MKKKVNSRVVIIRSNVASLGAFQLIRSMNTSMNVGMRFIRVSPRIASGEKTAKKAASMRMINLASVNSLFMFFLLFFDQVYILRMFIILNLFKL